MQFSLFKYFDAILDGVEQDGLAALEQPEVKKVLAELDSFLPPLSNVAKLVFSYYYVYQLKPQPLFISQLEKDLNVPTLYLKHEEAWQELVDLDLLVRVMGSEYLMPRSVIDAVAVIDLEYYWPNDRVIIAPEHKKEVFWRWIHDPQ